MDRRAFIAGTLWVLAAPRAGQAQPTGKVHRVGFIVTTSPLSEITGPEPIHPSVRAFVQGLRPSAMWKGRPSFWSAARAKDASIDSATSLPTSFASE